MRERAARPSTRDDVAASLGAVREPARCEDMTVVAWSMVGPVGVDVERRRAAGFDGFPGVVLHPAERARGVGQRTRTGGCARIAAQGDG